MLLFLLSPPTPFLPPAKKNDRRIRWLSTRHGCNKVNFIMCSDMDSEGNLQVFLAIFVVLLIVAIIGCCCGCCDCCCDCSGSGTNLSFDYSDDIFDIYDNIANGGSCSSSSSCSSGVCKDRRCAGSKCRPSACTSCDYDGDCDNCIAGYELRYDQCEVSTTTTEQTTTTTVTTLNLSMQLVEVLAASLGCSSIPNTTDLLGGGVSADGDTTLSNPGAPNASTCANLLAEAMALELAIAREAEMDAFLYLAYVGGGIIVLVAINFFVVEHFSPGTRDFDLFLIIVGGLLDATTDALYLNFEEFETPELKIAAYSVLGLPIAFISVVFWAGIMRSYSKQKMRTIIILIEGPIALIAVFVGTSTSWSWAAWKTLATMLVSSPWSSIRSAQNTMTGEGGFTDTLWTKETEVPGTERQQQEDGTYKKVEIAVDLKFWHKGLFQCNFAFCIFPILLLLAELLLLIAIIFCICIFITFAIVSAAVATSVALLLSVVIPTMFSVMAFLRLFVLFPSLWNAWARGAVWFAKQSNGGCGVMAQIDSDREVKIRREIFGLYNDGDIDVNDFKKSSVRYLLIEFLMESLPQMAIQVINNQMRGQWSLIGGFSIGASAYAIASTLYKYGYYYLCAKKRRL